MLGISKLNALREKLDDDDELDELDADNEALLAVLLRPTDSAAIRRATS